MGITDEDAAARSSIDCAAWQTGNEVLERGAVNACGIAITLCRELATGKTDAPFAVAVASVVCTTMTEFAAEAESVLAARIRDVVNPLKGLIRSREERPTV